MQNCPQHIKNMTSNTEAPNNDVSNDSVNDASNASYASDEYDDYPK